MGQIRNLTPHVVIILDPACAEYNPRTRSYDLKGDLIVSCRIEPDQVALPRVSSTEVEMEPVNGVPVVQVQYGEVENLPDAQDDVFLVVSAITANAVRDRQDLLIPARMVRDAQGKILGCLALAKA